MKLESDRRKENLKICLSEVFKQQQQQIKMSEK